MATTETKYQTNFYSAEKYQEYNKKFGTYVPNTDLVLVFSWYTKFLVTD